MQVAGVVTSDVIVAVAVSDLKPVHKGIKFEVTKNNLRLISCDGFRLAIRNETISNSENFNFVVPKKALMEVSTLIREDCSENCLISVNDRHIMFEINNFIIMLILRWIWSSSFLCW